MLKTLAAMLRDDEGATLVEYALIVALVSVAAIAALTLLGQNANTTLNNVAAKIANGN